MGILNRKFRFSWVTGIVAAGLSLVMASASAQQDTSRTEKAQRSERSEGSSAAESGGKSGKGDNGTVTARLSGDKQVPPVETKASGKSTIKVDNDKSVSGKVTVEDMTPTAAHIHQGPPDKDGPVIIPLNKTAKNTFSVPANTKLTDDQYAAFKEGNLYINVHSKKYPSGEVRAQMKP